MREYFCLERLALPWCLEELLVNVDTLDQSSLNLPARPCSTSLSTLTTCGLFYPVGHLPCSPGSGCPPHLRLARSSLLPASEDALVIGGQLASREEADSLTLIMPVHRGTGTAPLGSEPAAPHSVERHVRAHGVAVWDPSIYRLCIWVHGFMTTRRRSRRSSFEHNLPNTYSVPIPFAFSPPLPHIIIPRLDVS